MSRTRIGVIFAVVLVVLGIYVIAGGAFGGDSTDENQNKDVTATNGEVSPDTGQPLSAEEERGQMLFVDNCGSCHSLDAAGTHGTVGPSLDEAQNDEADVLKAIEQGGRQPGPPMPSNLLTGKDAQAVAKFVANSGPGV